MTYAPGLVVRVNEVFHDVEGAAYEKAHPEIMEDEAARWQGLGRDFLGGVAGGGDPPRAILDIGSGTGFVALQWTPLLGANDTFVCTDLAARMLDACRQRLAAMEVRCRLRYVKLDGGPLRAEGVGSGYDVVTMNSVLHHVPDPGPFLAALDPLLRPGGRLVIGHEPNRAFYTSAGLRAWSALARSLAEPRQAAGALLRRTGLMSLARRLLGRSGGGYGPVLEEVNRRLIAERTIAAPLGADELTAIVDIHSPTAGGFHRERGLDPRKLAAEFLPGYVVERLETYNHLGLHRPGRLVTLAQRLAQRYPDIGATFMAVFRKPAPVGLIDPTRR